MMNCVATVCGDFFSVTRKRDKKKNLGPAFGVKFNKPPQNEEKLAISSQHHPFFVCECLSASYSLLLENENPCQDEKKYPISVRNKYFKSLRTTFFLRRIVFVVSFATSEGILLSFYFLPPSFCELKI
jgi:hypothetical protein